MSSKINYLASNNFVVNICGTRDSAPQMDSVTQIVLGAAIGEAFLGTKEGRKGAIWVAILGTIPDLDVAIGFFVDPVTQLAVHRSGSHSILIALLAAPLIGSLLKRVHPKSKTSKMDWIAMTFFVFFTHIGIDICTVYGTQVFWPLSDYPYSFDNIFIIDPFYTLPLAIGVTTALLVKRSSRWRFGANLAGLLISSFYLTWSASAKLIAQGSFRQGLASKGFQVEKVMSAPTPLNTFLWMGMGLHQDTIRVGLYSVLDKRPPTGFYSVPRNSYLLNGHQDDIAIRRLMWFSKGWYAVEEDSLGLVYSDYRFGRNDAWLSDAGKPVFNFRLIPDSAGAFVSFQQEMPSLGQPIETLKLVFERAKGN